MQASIDRTARAAYLTLRDAPVARTDSADPGTLLDRDAAGRVVGIELLGLTDAEMDYLSQRPGSARIASVHASSVRHPVR